MPPAALATIAMLALVRTQCIAQFGADPLVAGTATALSRAITTLNARLPALAQAMAPVDIKAWTQLATISAASAQVASAAAAGLFTMPPETAEIYTMPGGLQMAQWAPLLDRIAALTPLIAAASQLGPDMTEPANLAEAMRQMNGLSVPALADPAAVASLTAVLDAVSRLQSVLGVDPATTPFQDIADLVATQAEEASAMVPARAQPPRITRNPAVLAPSAVVQAAMSPGLAKLAALTWQVPPASSMPVLANLLPVSALASTMPAGMAPQKRPCAQGCDAVALSRATL